MRMEPSSWPCYYSYNWSIWILVVVLYFGHDSSNNNNKNHRPTVLGVNGFTIVGTSISSSSRRNIKSSWGSSTYYYDDNLRLFIRNKSKRQSSWLKSNLDDNNLNEEIFSIAPMMGHTNRHYHSFLHDMLFSHFNDNNGNDVIHLYTEMIPASTIVQLARQSPDYETNIRSNHHPIRPEATLELQQLLRRTTPSKSTTLQLGGNDADMMAEAAWIAHTYFGYTSININCGCPSISVTGGGSGGVSSSSRSGGAALMRDAQHVANMLQQIAQGFNNNENKVQLSVKHRLGIRNDIHTYQPPPNKELDIQEEEESYQSCLNFAQTIASTNLVSRLQIHARLALLQPDDDDDDESTRLWVPGSTTRALGNQNNKKVNHSRVQYRAKQMARQATVTNRSAPPLRTNVVERVASSLKHHYDDLKIITNGGIQTIPQTYQRMQHPDISGVMVGRAVINHPCSFTNLNPQQLSSLSKDKHHHYNNNMDDSHSKDQHHHLKKHKTNVKTRGQVIEEYIHYCRKEEEEYEYQLSHYYHSDNKTNNNKNKRVDKLHNLSRKLIAVPFSLFAGEDGHDSYQRTIRKLTQKKMGTLSTEGILQAALKSIPDHILYDQLVTDVTNFNANDETNNKYSSGTKRSGPLQKVIW